MAVKRNVVERTLRSTRRAFSKYVKPGAKSATKSAEETIDHLLNVLSDARTALVGMKSKGSRKTSSRRRKTTSTRKVRTAAHKTARKVRRKVTGQSTRRPASKASTRQRATAHRAGRH